MRDIRVTQKRWWQGLGQRSRHGVLGRSALGLGQFLLPIAQFEKADVRGPGVSQDGLDFVCVGVEGADRAPGRGCAKARAVPKG